MASAGVSRVRKPQIISASRRTDIPAFYSQWLVNRLRAGWVLTCNPFNYRPVKVSLKPAEVAGIVLWSKNFGPLLPHLPEIDAMGYRCFFIFTITALPRVFEPRVVNSEEAIAAFKSLARRYSPDHVQWRYDPIVLTSLTDPDYHLRTFRSLCRRLEGYTKRCYTSFATFYAKVRRRMEGLAARAGIEVWEDPPADQQRQLAEELAEIAGQHGIELFSCCNDLLVGEKIKKAHCIDAKVLAPLFGLQPNLYRPKPTRPQCGCYESVDIGMYDTCPHLCAYCYANASPRKVLLNFRRYDPSLPGLPGPELVQPVPGSLDDGGRRLAPPQ